jgi:hypothetical protein
VTAASEETAAREETSGPDRRRLRVPTSVLVTVLVAALSVWVAPAFTRQWEDRKQARQLQAQVAEQMVLATATFGNSGRNALASRKEWRKIVDKWDLSQTQIEATLRVYFSPELRSSWIDFGRGIHAVAFLARVAHHNPPEENPGKIKDQLDRVANLSPPFREQVLTKLTDANVYTRRSGARELLLAVPGSANSIIDRLMAADPDAYSTSRGDLLRDLLP